MTDSVPKEKNRLYGRKQTRPLGDAKQAVMDSLLPKLQPDIDAIKARRQVEIEDLFGKPVSPVWFEIGFGSGEHLTALMKQHPDVYMIGAEPFINGTANFLYALHQENLPHDKVRVWMNDAIVLAGRLPDQSIDRIYILNPDPWPKKRHRKRRLVNQETLAIFARIMKPGGLLIMSTDVSELAEWMVTQASLHPDFTWTAQKADDWRKMPADWIPTRYEGKGKAKGRQQVYLLFTRKF